MGGDQHDRMFHRRQFADRASDKGRKIGSQFLRLGQNAPQGTDKELLIGFVEASDLGHMVFDHGDRIVGQQPLVNALQGELACATSRSLSFHLKAFNRLAISTAHAAQSSPFSRMRERAWSSFSVVSTPLAIGMLASRPTRVTPAAISFETISK